MAQADFSTPRPLRFGLIVLIALIHVAAVIGLMRAFAPNVVDAVVENVTSAIFVTVTAPTPTPTPTPKPKPAAAAPREQGAEGAAGQKAKPREVTAPLPRIVITETPAPRASSTGVENRSGGADAGAGTGAGSQGQGTGAGGEGSGQGGGGGAGRAAEKISGNINSARDYPRAGRDLRIGNSVVIAITVGIDGRPKACRVARPSPEPDTDRTTCELAMKRFRFRPATDAAGQPVKSVYGWQQRWFYKGQD
jgi:protein TonB